MSGTFEPDKDINPFDEETADLNPVAAKVVKARSKNEPPSGVHPLVALEELERGSPKPFKGRPDPKYPDLDSLEPLYMPRFLLREWGEFKFRHSAYYAMWRNAAAERAGADPKAASKKK